MGDIQNRGTKEKPRHSGRFRDLDRRRKRIPPQPTKELARQLLATAEANVARGLVGLPGRDKAAAVAARITIKELGQRFLGEYSSPKIRRIDRYKSTARSILECHIYPQFGHRVAADVDLHEIESFCGQMLQPGAKAKDTPYKGGTVRNVIRVMSRLYRWGQRARLLTCGCPTTGVIRPPQVGSLDYLNKDDPAEVERLLVIAPDYVPEEHALCLYPMLVVALFQGLRKGELFGLTWPDVAFAARRLDVNHSYDGPPKGGKPRSMELHAEALVALRQWKPKCPPTPQGLVFPVMRQRRRRGGSQKAGEWRMGLPNDMLGLKELLKAAGCHVADHPWHALRHTFAAEFLGAGGDIYKLRDLLGHTTVEITQIYGHLQRRKMDGEIQRISYASGEATVTSISTARGPK